MKGKRISDLILAGALLIGLSLLLYPTVSSYWNARHQSRAISGYRQRTQALTAAGAADLLDQARAYNQALALQGGGFACSPAEKAAFCALLGSDGGVVGCLKIPTIQAELPVYLGSSESVLQTGIGVLEGSSAPVGGPSTHTVLTGHRGLPSATLFTHLDRLEEGDRFSLQVLGEELWYEVDQIRIVDPEDLTELEIQPEEDLCTLVTCTPYGINTQRLLVRGRRVWPEAEPIPLRLTAEAAQLRPSAVAPVMGAAILAVSSAALGAARLLKRFWRRIGERSEWT